VKNTCEQEPSAAIDTADHEIRHAVQIRYAREYTTQWEQFLASLQLREVQDIADADKILATLTSADPPLRKLVKSITAHTKFSKMPDANFLGKSSIEKLSDALNSKGITKEPNTIESHFFAINQFLNEKDGGNPLVADMDRHLVDLSNYISSISKSSDASESAYQAARLRMTNDRVDAIKELLTVAKASPVPVSNILRAIAEESWGTILLQAKLHIDDVWDTTARESCVDHITDRYPVNRSSDRDIALLDFGNFFGVGGEIDTFTDDYLKPFVDRNRWQSKTLDNKNIPFNDAFVEQMRRAEAIQRIYFSIEDKRPATSFHLTPIELDSGAYEAILSIHGKDMSYTHGPDVELEQSIKWPGPEESGGVRLYFGRDDYTETETLEFLGPWALFRFLDVAKPSRQTRTEVTVEYTIDSLWIRYKIRANSDDNPFTGDADPVSRFRCPENT